MPLSDYVEGGLKEGLNRVWEVGEKAAQMFRESDVPKTPFAELLYQPPEVYPPPPPRQEGESFSLTPMDVPPDQKESEPEWDIELAKPYSRITSIPAVKEVLEEKEYSDDRETYSGPVSALRQKEVEGAGEVEGADAKEELTDLERSMGLRSAGLGLAQMQAGADAPAYEETLGGLATAAGGMLQLNGNSKVGMGVSILGTLINMRGQRESARMARDQRAGFANALSSALKVGSSISG